MKWEIADVDFAKQKLDSVLSQIDLLATSDFPYPEPRDALKRLRELYESDIKRLKSITDTTDADVRRSICQNANFNVARYKGILGFILRSTNVRNAFEAYDPLNRLSKRLLGDDAKLILSSEWDFSPFTYPAAFRELPKYIFIGTPASESQNALVLPLSGHELGHSVWRHTEIEKKYRTLTQQAVIRNYTGNWEKFTKLFGPVDVAKIETDLYVRDIWLRSYQMSMRQCEEVFCDILGIRIFGESFLYAFMYLIAPCIVGRRSEYYPSLGDRVHYIEQAANHFGFPVPSRFSEYFHEPKRTDLAPNIEFLLAMSDLSTSQVFLELLASVKEYAERIDLPLPSKEMTTRVVRRYGKLSPYEGSATLGDLVNAGWAIRLDFSIWDRFSVADDEKISVLNDLVFKSLEVMEFETRVRPT